MSLCHAHHAFNAGSALSLFLLGLAGSAHCLGMCGPLSCLAQGNSPQSKAVLGSYHLARALAYALLGFTVAALGQPLQPLLSPLWLALLGGLPLLLFAILGREAVPGWLSGAHRAVARRLGALPPVSRGAGLGLLSPALPCGLLYAAAAASLAAPSPADGALWMLSFAAGTLPALLLGQAGFRWAAQRGPLLSLRLQRGAALVAALSLLMLALSA